MSYMPSHLLLCVSVFLFAFVYQGKAYDPLETFESIETLDRKIKDKSRDRSIPLNPNHHRVILGLSTAFWDAYLRKDAEARSWLNGDSPRNVMEKQDRWQKK